MLKEKIRVLLIAPSSLPEEKKFISAIIKGKEEGFDFYIYRRGEIEKPEHSLKFLKERAELSYSELLNLKIKELKFALEQNEFKIIMAIRGGFFSSLVLEGLNKEKIKVSSERKLFSGGSDFSFVKFFIRKHYENIDFIYFPMLISDFLFKSKIRRIKTIFKAYLRGEKKTENLKRFFWIREGELGGESFLCCLTMLSQSIGTFYQPELYGKTLFLEDINESPERIIRLLNHLKDAGIFRKTKGIVFNDFLLKKSERERLLKYLKEFFTFYTEGVVFGEKFGHSKSRKYIFDENKVYTMESKIVV